MADAKPRFIKKEIIREALDASPNSQTNTIARKLLKENPGVWANLDAVRWQVRRARGAVGNDLRKYKTHDRPIELPKPDSSGWAVHELPIGIKRWLIISDMHVPYHSKSLKTALEYGRGQCDGVLILGDLMDFYQLSVFEKDPRKRNCESEIEMTQKVLDAVEKLQPKKIIYKGGNHEARLPRYLMQRVPEMFAVIDLHCNMDSILGLTQRGITWIHDRHALVHQELTLLHGHEFGNRFSSPVNPARGAFLRAHACVLQGHEHRTSDHTETTINGVAISCWSLGSLCDSHPMYRPINQWNHGFAVLDTTGRKWKISNHRIIDEKDVT